MIAFTFDVLSAVSVLVVVVLGMAIIVSMMGIFNLAHGQFVLLGAVGFLLIERHIVGGFPAVAGAVLVAACIGALTEIVVIRRLYSRPIAAVLATFGLGLVLQESVRLVIGNVAQGSSAPVGGVATIGTYHLEQWRLWVIGLAILSVIAVFGAIERTALGLQMRATLVNAPLARASGLRTRRIYTLTFTLGAALAAFAGALVAPLTTVFPELGQSYLVLAFLAVMVGGPGTFAGPILGAILIGSANVALARVVSPVYAEVLVVVAAIVVMRLRPRGLLGAPLEFAT